MSLPLFKVVSSFDRRVNIPFWSCSWTTWILAGFLSMTSPIFFLGLSMNFFPFLGIIIYNSFLNHLVSLWPAYMRVISDKCAVSWCRYQGWFLYSTRGVFRTSHWRHLNTSRSGADRYLQSFLSMSGESFGVKSGSPWDRMLDTIIRKSRPRVSLSFDWISAQGLVDGKMVHSLRPIGPLWNGSKRRFGFILVNLFFFPF